MKAQQALATARKHGRDVVADGERLTLWNPRKALPGEVVDALAGALSAAAFVEHEEPAS